MTISHRIIKNPSGYHSRGSNPKEKAFNFAKFIKQYGWTGSWSENQDNGDIMLVAQRNGERIEVSWNTPIPWPEVWYFYGGSKLKCRNISQAAKFAQEKPDPNRMRKSARKARPKIPGISSAYLAEAGNTDSSADLIESMSLTLPFDRESTAEEIKAVLKTHINPTIIWINRLSGAAEQDYIKTWSRYLTVTENKEGKKIINFVGANCFHAVYVDSVIGIS